MTGWGARWRGVLMCVALIVGMAPVTARATAPATQTPLSHSETKIGRAAATDTVSITLPLAVDTAAVDAYLARLYDPASPDYHRFLTPAEFTTRFVDHAARQEVVSFLTGQGLTVHDPGLGSTIRAEAPAAQIERAFNVQLDRYQAADGRTFIAADRTAALPANVAGRVRNVIGLEGASPAKPHIVPAQPPEGAGSTGGAGSRTASGCSGAVDAARRYAAFTPNQLATAYNIDALHTAGFNGEGQTVALFELADFVDANIATWKGCFPSGTPVTRVPVDGGAAGQYYGEDEVELDIEVVLGQAPHLGQLLVYEAPNDTSPLVDEYQRIANDNLASAVSTSWGLCEAYNSTASAEYTIFQQMAAQGMTMFAAAGDHGTNDCQNGTIGVDDPASQPYVSGVGGTHLTVNSGTNAYVSESVWNDGRYNGWGGGGGLSSVWPRPPWQTGPGVSNGYSNGNRQVPDVAADGDSTSAYVVYALGAWTAYGGTSAGAPLWAAGTALVNQKLAANGGRVGFGNAVWYTLLGRPSPPYHDVTAGNNCVAPSPCTPNTYPATAAYDQATGVGTPDFGALATALAPPPTLAGITPASGPSTGGTTVTITGTNFRTGIAVRFGAQPAASVTVLSDTTLAAVSPAQPIPGAVSVTVQNVGDAQASGNLLFGYTVPPHATGTPVTPGAIPNIAPPAGGHLAAPTVAAAPLPQPARH